MPVESLVVSVGTGLFVAALCVALWVGEGGPDRTGYWRGVFFGLLMGLGLWWLMG